MQFAISQEIKPSFNQAIQIRSPYDLRKARIASRKQNAQSLKKSTFKSRKIKQSKGKHVAKKAPNRPVYTQKIVVATSTKEANLASDATSVANKASLIQKAASDTSTALEFDSNYQNYQECEYESTYLQSYFKTTPVFAEKVASAQEGKPVCASYFLRSCVASNVRINPETVAKPVFLPYFGEKPAKMVECSASDAPKKTAVTDQGFKRPSKIAWSVKISGIASPHFGMANASDVVISRKMALPPLSMKMFRETAPMDNVALEVTSMKSAPPALKALKPKSHPAVTYTSSFLMIKEKEFPHLFENPVVRHQRMSKFFAEQDFNSDCETVERNKVDLLTQLEQTISRYNKNEPTKFVENLKSPPSNTDAAPIIERNATPAGASTPVFSGAFSMKTEQLPQTDSSKVADDNQNKKSSFRKLELVIDTSGSIRDQVAMNPFSPLDECMESPKSASSPISPGTSLQADVDSASIAFGVMYQPRARVQRIDQFNCDTRLLREGHDDIEHSQNFILFEDSERAQKDGLRLGFVPKATEARPGSFSQSI